MNRRAAVGVLGSLAFGTVAAAWGQRALTQPVCTLTPEQIEGPFYLDQPRIREAISEGRPGVPLQLILRVLEASASCAPIPTAAVDEIGRRRVGKECRSRWSPYQSKQ